MPALTLILIGLVCQIASTALLLADLNTPALIAAIAAMLCMLSSVALTIKKFRS